MFQIAPSQLQDNQGFNFNSLIKTDQHLLDNNLASDFVTLVDEVTRSHMFIKQIMRGNYIPMAAELPQVQKVIEKFAVGTSLASKVITNMVKNIDTLVRLQ